MSEQSQSLRNFSSALEEHGTEGIEILTAEPAKSAIATILLLTLLLVTAFVWSFIGRADVVVTTVGQLGPDSEIRRVYAPIGGELVDVYVAEGAPVEKGDLLARINSIAAIETASRALDSELKLLSAEEELRKFPLRKQAMQQRAESVGKQIEVEKQRQQKRQSEDMAKLAEGQKLKLNKARAEVDKAQAERDHAKQEMEKYIRLSNIADGGGGVSRVKVDEKRNEFRLKDSALKLVVNRLAEIEIELKDEYAKKQKEIRDKFQQLASLEVDYKEQLLKIEAEEMRIKAQVELSRQSAEGASLITFKNIDQDNFLRINAPVSGVITSINYREQGVQVKPSQPIAGIAPANAKLVLYVEIREQDRGFLKEGLPIKMKFKAFPYQNHGIIEGKLEYISPATVISPITKAPVYRGRISLSKEYFLVGGVKYNLRYGMTAVAEVVVRKRRLIDLALDPIRKITI